MEAVGFFGLKIVPSRSYSLLVAHTFRVTMATLDESLVDAYTDTPMTSLHVKVDDREFILCTLIPGKITQQLLDITFVKGEQIMFSLFGTHTIHLTGNYVRMAKNAEEKVHQIEDSDSDDLDDDELERLLEDEISQEDYRNDINDGSHGGSLIDFGNVSQSKKKSITTSDYSLEQRKAWTSKKRKLVVNTTESGPLHAEHDADPENEHQVNKLTNGLIIENKIIGTGEQVKNGMKIGVQYVGKFVNGKVFDRTSSSGKPFKFVLGKGEVIKGLDQGIVGMSLNGVRKLTIPPSLAYGKDGALPQILENATLIYEINLVSMEHCL
ncbi:unnamed protein product [Absidia cylindrospora]